MLKTSTIDISISKLTGKTGLTLFLALGLMLLATTPLWSADESTVSATVSVQNISVTISDADVEYGTLGTSASEDTTLSGVNDTQTATNNGNIAEDLNIKGVNTANWTLQTVPGVDQYSHEFCTTTCDGSPSWTAMTTSYQLLSNAVGQSGTQDFDLQIGTPTSTATFGQQAPDVIVQAVIDS